jgi:hypothetical protein
MKKADVSKAIEEGRNLVYRRSDVAWRQPEAVKPLAVNFATVGGRHSTRGDVSSTPTSKVRVEMLQADGTSHTPPRYDVVQLSQLYDEDPVEHIRRRQRELRESRERDRLRREEQARVQTDMRALAELVGLPPSVVGSTWGGRVTVTLDAEQFTNLVRRPSTVDAVVAEANLPRHHPGAAIPIPPEDS